MFYLTMYTAIINFVEISIYVSVERTVIKVISHMQLKGISAFITI